MNLNAKSTAPEGFEPTFGSKTFVPPPLPIFKP
jgi:hypothetical protein